MSERPEADPQEAPPDLAIILVAYQAAGVIEECLPTVLEHLGGVSCRVLIVDNGSTDNTVERVRARFPQVTVIEMGHNAGFARANNAGIAACPARHVLLLNTDVKFEDDVLGPLVRHLDENPQVAAVTPGMVDGQGRPLAPGRGLPRWWSPLEGSGREVMGGLAPWLRTHLNRLAGRGEMMAPQAGADASPVEVEWICGACMMLSGEALRRIGKLDEHFFVFFEDVEWCARARKAGMIIQVLPGLRVIHLVGGGKPRSLVALKAYAESEFLYHKLHNPRWLWFVRLTLLAHQTCSLLMLPLRMLRRSARPGEGGVRMGLVRGLLTPGWTPGEGK